MNRDTIRRDRDLRSWREVRPLFLAMILVWLCVWAVFAHAASAEKPWDTNVQPWTFDGTCKSGTGCPIQGFELQEAATPTATAWKPIASLAPSARSYTMNGVSEGQHCYRLIALIVPVGNGVNSDPSNVKCKTNVKPAVQQPNSPVLTSVAQDAYQIGLAKKNVLQAFVIGLVPVGAKCTTQRYLDLYVIEDNTKAILPAGTRRPIQILARCV